MIKRTSAPEAGESDAVSQEKKTEPVKDTLPVPEKPAPDATEAPVVEAAPKAQTAPTVECTHTLLSSLPAAFTVNNSCSDWALSCLENYPLLTASYTVFVRQPEICLAGELLTPAIRLSSGSTSRWTPLP